MIKGNYTAPKKLLLNFQNSQLKKRGETLFGKCMHFYQHGYIKHRSVVRFFVYSYIFIYFCLNTVNCLIRAHSQ